MEETPHLDQAIDLVYSRLEQVGGDPAKLPPMLQPIAVLYHVQGIVDNGGFRYLFENDLPFQPSHNYIADSYRAIDSPEAAALLEQAIAHFAFADPEKDSEARNAYMDTLDEDDPFFSLSDATYDLHIWEKMDRYVLQHADEFAA